MIAQVPPGSFEWKQPRPQRMGRADRSVTRQPEKLAKTEENLPTTYQGKGVKSKEEGRVIVTVPRLGFTFRYQVPFFGGYGVRGAQILDFLIYGVVFLPSPLFVQSRYFHGGIKAEASTFDVRDFDRLTNGRYAPAREVWDDDLTSLEQAYVTLRQLLGRM